MSENIKNKLNPYVERNRRTEVYLHQHHNGQHSVGLMCSHGKNVYFSDGIAIDFENAFNQALFELKQQLSEK